MYAIVFYKDDENTGEISGASEVVGPFPTEEAARTEAKKLWAFRGEYDVVPIHADGQR